ncbi:hypothetical protein BDN72DRAFT_842846 [Pluteus cervinus]|uniref:Uncharacterized protein n=1 Tax=Pluteus cervinus TaxID=181527 RepID=A0ACD3APD4_9AGAR|nr:hypothetical protein BDN72DRAFT_842846 [Pluteus cervinus]
MQDVSTLGPIDPASIPEISNEQEKAAPWIVRKLVGSMTGRIVMSSYESLRAAGTSVICLSPWGDSSPLLLPCIRFRDLAVHTVIVATGGMAAVAAPVMGPVSDVVMSSFGDSILVEVGLHEGFGLTTKMANDLVFGKPIKHFVGLHSDRLVTTGVKVLLITMRYKHTIDDAALGFYRGSVHKDPSLFSSVKDYLAVEKGWFSPYLFASARRPIIPRTMTPDIVFCHGPFLAADYLVGERLLSESESAIVLCERVEPEPSDEEEKKPEHKLSIPKLPNLGSLFSKSRPPSPEPAVTPLPKPPMPRRLAVMLVGLKPHRKLWTTSARPGESVMRYILLNGCPAVVIPVKTGTPLVAWDTLTLEKLWKIQIPEDGKEETETGKFEGMVKVLFEYLDLCVAWDRVVVKEVQDTEPEQAKKDVLKDALKLLVASAIRSQESKEAKNEIDPERCGIAMWRIP